MRPWLQQYLGQLYRASILKGRQPFKLILELLIPFFLLTSLLYLKGQTVAETKPLTHYDGEVGQIPEIEEFCSLPTLQTVAGTTTDGLWYLMNFEKFARNGAGNIAYTCLLESVIQSPSDFGEICSELKFAVIPEDKSNGAQSSMAEEFAQHLATKASGKLASRILNVDSVKDNLSLDDYIKSEAYGSSNNPKIGAAVVFRSDTSYFIRVNKTSGEYGTRGGNIPANFRPPTDELSRGKTRYNEKYLLSGFLSMQKAVDEFILSKKLGKSVSVSANHFPMPTYEYSVDEFWVQTGSSFALFMFIALLYPIAMVINMLVLEKEIKFRDLMFVMGLEPSAYQAAWLTLFLGFFILQAAWLTLITVAGKLFESSDTLIIFLFYMLYFIASVAHAFLVSSFFERTTLATMVGVLISFVAYFMYVTIDNPETAASVKVIASIFHPTAAFGFGTTAFAKQEGARIGITWDNYGDTKESNYSVQMCLITMTVDFFLYLFLGVYFDAALPTNTQAARENWHFPFTSWMQPFSRSARIKRDPSMLENDAIYQRLVARQEEDEEMLAESSIFEPVPESLKDARREGRSIFLKDLQKVYRTAKGKVRAIRGVTFSMFEGQITALLGSNGAGKSTLSGILSGMLTSTSGEAIVNGFSCKTDSRMIRKELGVCPQHNVYSPLMSVEEHLQLFASIKCIPKAQIRSKVRKIIADVGLTAQIFTGASYLSGGMKRKMQLAMALLDSKICILDEPTSGLDVSSRQLIQKTISQYREGRTIILTTHYMDEADLLGDRIAIMAKGRLQCCGSSLFLKKRFGVGYLITITQGISAQSVERKGVIEMIQRHIPESQIVTNAGTELIMKTPLSASKKFAGLLRDLDSNKDRLQILNKPGISVTNLESVFLRVAEQAEAQAALEDEQAARAEKHKSNSSSGLSDGKEIGSFVVPVEDPVAAGGDDVLDTTSREILDESKSYMLRHVKTLIGKRWLNSKRDIRVWCCQFLIPAVFLLLGFIVLNINFASEVTAYEINENTDDWNPTNNNPIPFSVPETRTLASGLSIPRIELSEEIEVGNPSGSFCRPMENATAAWDENLQFLSFFLPAAQLLPPFENFANLTDVCYGDQPYSDTLRDFSEALVNRPQTKGSKYAGVLLNSLVTETTSVETEFTLAYNFSAVHALPYMLNRVHSALLNALGNGNDDIKLGIDVLPDTLQENFIEYGFEAFTATLVIGISFAFVPTAYAVFLVRERETKAWHQQLVNGVSPVAYWISNYLFDLLTYVFPLAFTVTLIFAYDLKAFTENFAPVFLLFFLYGLASTPFTYCLSYAFSTSSFAQFGTLLVNLLGSVVLLLVSFITTLITSTFQNNMRWQYAYRLIPSFSLAHGLLQIGNLDLFAALYNSEDYGGNPDKPVEYTPWSADIAGLDMTYLAIEAVGYLAVLILLQTKFRGGLCSSTKLQTFSYATDDESGIVLEDDDVKAERNLIEGYSMSELKEITKDDNDSDIKAAFSRVRKVYSDGKVAVQSLSLGLRNNECFGLLGSNGAGKSTSFGMLSGEFSPTEGRIFIGGADIVKEQAKAQRRLGYCPQVDAIFDLMTGREHLMFYGRVKGIRESMLKQVVQKTLEELLLTEFADKPAGGYSGGNKRKLSVAMATMGLPSLVLLDEPSAGIDPNSRRLVASFVERLSKKTSVVLTTHSMEECEALCGRIGIMVEGGLRCLGSVQHIKSRYGKGYHLEATIEIADRKELEKIVDSFGVASPHAPIRIGQLDAAFADSGNTDLMETNYANSSLQVQITNGSGYVSALALAEWIVNERNFNKIKEMLHAKFSPEVELVERQGQRLRFKIPDASGLTLADMFEIIENNRKRVGIEEFSLSQTTLETIFNYFAATEGTYEKPRSKGLVQALPTRRT